MSLKYEPSSEPLHIHAKKLFFNRCGYMDVPTDKVTERPVYSSYVPSVAQCVGKEGRYTTIWKMRIQIPLAQGRPTKIILMIEWIQTSRLAIRISLWVRERGPSSWLKRLQHASCSPSIYIYIFTYIYIHTYIYIYIKYIYMYGERSRNESRDLVHAPLAVGA